MSVYKPTGTDIYVYDFRMNGVRYSGSTGATDLEEARLIEQTLKDGIVSVSPFMRGIIRKARRNLPTRPSGKRSYVYVVKSGYLVKIGCSNDPADRVRSINTALPEGCKMLFYFIGDQKTERALHAEFAACHYQKEWFFYCGKMKAFIEEFERHFSAGYHPLDAEITAKSPQITSASPLRI